MTEPKLPAEPTSTSQDVLVSHEYIDYVSALREAAEKALALAAEREVEIARWKERHGNLYAAVVDSGCAANGDRFVKNLRAEAANARAEAAEKDAKRLQSLEMTYVYVIARLSMTERDYDRPEIGDWAVEASHLIGMPRTKPVALPTAIGKVISKEMGDVYTLKLLNGNEQRWENAMMRKLPNLDAAIDAMVKP